MAPQPMRESFAHSPVRLTCLPSMRLGIFPHAPSSSRPDFFAQRFLAALRAISERFFALSAFARAAPPLSPPSRPSATAAGFFSGAAVFFFATWFLPRFA